MSSASPLASPGSRLSWPWRRFRRHFAPCVSILPGLCAMSSTGVHRRAGSSHRCRPIRLLFSRPSRDADQPPGGPAMGVTHFTTIISLKGSNTYLLFPPRRWHCGCDPESGARSTATLRRLGFVWLWRLRRGCRSAHSHFSKCCISRMMGLIRQTVEHFGFSAVCMVNASL